MKGQPYNSDPVQAVVTNSNGLFFHSSCAKGPAPRCLITGQLQIWPGAENGRRLGRKSPQITSVSVSLVGPCLSPDLLLHVWMPGLTWWWDQVHILGEHRAVSCTWASAEVHLQLPGAPWHDTEQGDFCAWFPSPSIASALIHTRPPTATYVASCPLQNAVV